MAVNKAKELMEWGDALKASRTLSSMNSRLKDFSKSESGEKNSIFFSSLLLSDFGGARCSTKILK